MRARGASVSWPDYILAGSVGALVLIAWWTLWLWGRSPAAHLLMHGSAHLGPAGIDLWYYAGIFVLGWTLMSIAMMLPTVVPLLVLFRRVVAGRSNQVLLVSLVVGGYLAVWIAFGICGQWMNRLLVRVWWKIPWIAASPWITSAAILAVAGLYQFSRIKYACLEKCRTPLSFIVSRWRGGFEPLQALRIGMDHGAFCVGCCWSLMLLMFLVGAGSLGWMFLLGVVMALEKNSPWGRKTSAPIGGLLLSAAAIVFYLGMFRGD